MDEMIVFLNGRFVSEEQALVSAFDRSFLYGDGLFETIRISAGKPFRWEQHWERLEHGMEFLKLKAPFTTDALFASVTELIQRNQTGEGVLRVTVSRGVGPRGYSPRGAEQPITVMSVHAGSVLDHRGPQQWNLVTSSFRLLANAALAQFKTCNKLTQVMARAEADAAGAQEALLLNSEGQVAEGASSNLFWIRDSVVCTPPLTSGVLPGVTRTVVLELCHKEEIPSTVAMLAPEELSQCEGIFLSLSTVGIAEAVSVDSKPLQRSPITKRLYAGFLKLIRDECADL
jgi:aminodeoxychorismate lyase